ncbi:DUF3945 domain-containing protein [Chryseobacterium defluvii]|uniref:Uncharacterized protein DUF3945 n=1 Tax=Chryseobacterium defluvii TaxID=160396 RepID=A0A495SNE6_9FLAO|nr:DUF3945 domain-containing protein [Chryseobacterium defluvii]RKT01811.1 uncharacterized protein DUF3945 [Chryseobacterium defluvii]
MEEIKEQKPELPDQFTDIILVMDQEKKKIMAVKSMGQDGKMETIDPSKSNQQEFMRVDRQGDVFSNFFSNFSRQLKEPTRFKFFRVPYKFGLKVAGKLQKHLETFTEEGEKMMKLYEIKPIENNSQIQQPMATPESTTTEKEVSKTETVVQDATPTKTYRFQEYQLDWETLNSLGLSKERLEKKGFLEPLLMGRKTDGIISVSLNLGSAITRTDARLSLQPGENDKAVMVIHGIRKSPSLDFPFLGYTFTDEDKNNLKHTRNLGRVVDLTNPKTGEKIPSLVSIDRYTNELVAYRADRIKIDDEIKGVKLSDEQKSSLKNGEPVYIQNMWSETKQKHFNSHVQFNADKGFTEFIFNREAPRFVNGKQLADEEYKNLKDGRTVFVTGMKDREGQEYSGYLTYNKNTMKVDFSKNDPENKIKEKLQPSEDHKTQIEVNNKGKTHEATKAINEPLKTGQVEPINIEQKETQKTNKRKMKMG